MGQSDLGPYFFVFFFFLYKKAFNPYIKQTS